MTRYLTSPHSSFPNGSFAGVPSAYSFFSTVASSAVGSLTTAGASRSLETAMAILYERRQQKLKGRKVRRREPGEDKSKWARSSRRNAGQLFFSFFFSCAWQCSVWLMGLGFTPYVCEVISGQIWLISAITASYDDYDQSWHYVWEDRC